MIYFDLDGTIRNLCQPLFGDKEVSHWRERTASGETISNYIDRNLHILEDCPPTEYYPVVNALPYAPTILTHQRQNWVSYTERWLRKHFDAFHMIIVDSIRDKEPYLKSGDWLIDDYPFFSDDITDRLILIDYPYNRESKCKFRVKTPKELEDVLRLYCA